MKDPREAEELFDKVMTGLTTSHSLVTAVILGELAFKLDESAFADIMDLLEEKLNQTYERASMFWEALEEDEK